MAEEQKKPRKPRKKKEAREVYGAADGKPIKRGRGRPRKADAHLPVKLDSPTALDKARAVDEKLSQPWSSLAGSLRLLALPPIDDNDVDQVNDRIVDYLKICEEEGMPVTKEGLALAFRVDRRTLNYWLAGATRKPQEVIDALKVADSLINTILAQDGLRREGNPAFRIFLMRNNNAGYTNDDDKLNETEIDYEGRKRSADEIARKYEDIVEDD